MNISDVTDQPETPDPGAYYEEPTPNGHHADDEEAPHWQAIFSAPNYADLIRTRQSARAREYRDRTNSLLKAGLIGAINSGEFTDAATILRHGPAFATATGQLADSNDRAAALIDMITSPASPVAMFVLAAIPLVSQLFRNHEAQLANIPEAREQAKRTKKSIRLARKAEEPRFTIKILKWHIPVHWHPKRPNLSKLFKGFRSQTVDPGALAADVFTDRDVIKALEKMGILVADTRRD